MAPKLVLKQNHPSNLIVKKLNRTLMINAKLRKQIALLSNQNKELSMTRNDLLLHKLKIENENISIKNSNVQLTAMHHAVCKQLSLVEQNLQKCVPALVTMSTSIPNVLQSVHEMSKLERFNEFSQKEKKEKQTKCVSPMINGMTINQPAVTLRRLDLSTINESPELTPKRPRSRFARRSSPHNNLEPYVRLKDVKLMIKNSKAVPSENTYQQSEENVGEGPSWLYSQENQIHNSVNDKSCQDNSGATDNFKASTPVLSQKNTPSISTLEIPSCKSSMNSTLNESDVRNEEPINTSESSMFKNITCRKLKNRRSSETSVASDIDDSTVSIRSRRSAARRVNYKEPALGSKLRRN